MAQGWQILSSGLSVEPEQRYKEHGVAYLGCTIERTSLMLAGGQMAIASAYNMEIFINLCVDMYRMFAQ
eukprot:2637902-Lingulodinium_polyedra.AAC.1